ncbi:MAG: S9 family peptidase [Candidatus Thermoplasmatota archaeon]|nr:S9 family peptidase [Candidatus Thermoplasmatota archaeon]
MIDLHKKRNPFSFERMMDIDRISSPTVHPGGRLVAFVKTIHDHIENNVSSTIMLLDVNTKEQRELTPGDSKDTSPLWSPCGKLLAFVSKRSGDQQIWILPFENGGEAWKLTEGEGSVSSPTWSKDGKYMAFARDVVVSPHWDGSSEGIEGDDREKVKLARTYGLVNEKSSARVETDLLYRHWDHWRDMKRSHLHIVDLDTREVMDITPGDSDVPPISLGGTQDISFSSDGEEMVYVMNPDPEVAVSTNNSIYVQRMDGLEPAGDPVRISTNDAMDLDPRYSPDGRYIAYLGAERPTFEADRLRIKLYDRDTGKTTVLTEELDRSASDPIWSGDGSRIFFLSADMGHVSIYSVDLNGVVKQHTSGSFNSDLRVLPGKGIIVTRESMTSPKDLYMMDPGEGFEPDLGTDGLQTGMEPENIVKLTDNGDILQRNVELYSPEEFWFKGADDDPVHGFLIRPPGFDPERKWPTLLIIHGGPQSAFFNHFHYRWNPQMFAAEGYVVLELNPRGSIGYGQKFTDQISGDWGGRCYEDIMKGLDFALENFSFIDQDRLGSAGASFGGFMMNWIAGHSDRFNVLVSHDGIFNQETMSYMTEELWFDMWEHGGMPHDDHEKFLKFSPHMYVQNFKTPMLVIQGELDFRCPVSEGVSLFTALKVMKVPSKFLYFPDEGHWVLKPANSQVWYRTIMDFIKEYI